MSGKIVVEVFEPLNECRSSVPAPKPRAPYLSIPPVTLTYTFGEATQSVDTVTWSLKLSV